MAKDTKLSLGKLDEFLASKGGIGDSTVTAVMPTFYPLGIPTIDYGLGGGKNMAGIPMAQMTEIFGPHACGKTTIAYHAIAQAQRDHADKVHVLIDIEGTSDPRYIEACGIDRHKTAKISGVDALTFRLFRSPRVKTLEDAIEIFLLFHRTGHLGLCVVDSLAAANPAKELERIKEDLTGNAGVSAKAKRMADISRLLISELGGTESALVWINHEIANIQTNPYAGGPSKTTPGGDAVKYYSALRLQLIPKGNETEEMKTLDGKDIKMSVGKKIQLYVEKNKLGDYGQRVNYIIRPSEGIDAVTPLIALAIQAGVITKSKGGKHAVTLPGFEDVAESSAEKFRKLLKSRVDAQDALNQAVRSIVLPDFSAVEAVLGTTAVDEVDFED
jgi:recombination protein RecA